MSKTNKELAVEIVVALINANPRLVYKNGNSISSSLTLEAVNNVIVSVNETLENLDKKVSE
ncbi:hypothetical protein [Paenibacillus bouchesdurhonensis]|uniref:hypothetical protein n=1 Tax=Paenibacillus bouchesdurhonensis TaxID=1870990 RepID=UPI000DA5F874|nr:hypothetical protein [Paenibacillus bouchesdurhonensis]